MATPKKESDLVISYFGRRADPAGIGAATYQVLLKSVLPYLTGSGPHMANQLFDDVRTLAPAAHEDLAVADGSLQNSLGEVIAMLSMRRLAVQNRSTETAMLIGGAAHPIVTGFLTSGGKITVQPGGLFAWDSPNGGAESDSEDTDELRIAHAGLLAEALTYGIVIEGAGQDTPSSDSLSPTNGPDLQPICSLWDAGTYPLGFGRKVVGGSFTQGFTVPGPPYARDENSDGSWGGRKWAQPLSAVVLQDITGGSGPLTVTVTGTAIKYSDTYSRDYTETVPQTWTGTFVTNNPVAAVSHAYKGIYFRYLNPNPSTGKFGIPPISCYEGYITMADPTTGFAQGNFTHGGQILTVDPGTGHEETVWCSGKGNLQIPDQASGTVPIFMTDKWFSAWWHPLGGAWLYDHSAGGTLQGKHTLALRAATWESNCVSVTGVTLSGSGHSGGLIEIAGGG